MIKVLLSNPLEATSLAMRFALETYPDIVVIGVAQTADAVCHLCTQNCPDVVVFELLDDDFTKFDLGKRLHAIYQHIALIVLVHLAQMSEDELDALEISAGIYMTTPLDELVSLIRIASDPHTYH